MGMLLLGLVLFLGCHSVRVFAEPWRENVLLQWGEKKYKGLYSLASVVGFVLIVYGFSIASMGSPTLWIPPVATRHVASLLMLLAIILLVAAYVPNNAIKHRLKHPMVLSVKVWALAHLLANGRVVDLILFGTFLVWSVLLFRASRQRDQWQADLQIETNDAPTIASSTTTRVCVIGALVWAALLLGGHAWLFGVSPVGLGFTGL